MVHRKRGGKFIEFSYEDVTNTRIEINCYCSGREDINFHGAEDSTRARKMNWRKERDERHCEYSIDGAKFPIKF